MRKTFTALLYVFAFIGFALVSVFFAVKLGVTNTEGIIDTQRTGFLESSSQPAWTNTDLWPVLKEAILKDKTTILQASQDADIQPRLLVSILVVEQLRLYNDNRELFKTFFSPLKVLGNQNQFSWGVMGVKQETAKMTEDFLKDKQTAFYPGITYEHLLDFTSEDHDQERFVRLTNEHDRYYSYLYAALILKELQTQWDKAGFPIKDRPDILSTLYDIGFDHSLPHASPSSGGAAITIGTTTYSFGHLSKEFYYSHELEKEFPQ